MHRRVPRHRPQHRRPNFLVKFVREFGDPMLRGVNTGLAVSLGLIVTYAVVTVSLVVSSMGPGTQLW